jgi:RNA polymerase sigma factor (sigma-70 family)
VTERGAGASEADLATTVDADLFRSVYVAARRFAAFIAPAGVDPDDLVQEALVRVLARTSLGALAEPLAYLRTTMLNLVRNEHRRRGRESAALARVDAAAASEDHASSVVATDIVTRSLENLPPDSRALLFLVDAEGLSIAAAADVVGLTSAGARKRLSRVRLVVRTALNEAQEDRP